MKNKDSINMSRFYLDRFLALENGDRRNNYHLLKESIEENPSLDNHICYLYETIDDPTKTGIDYLFSLEYKKKILFSLAKTILSMNNVEFNYDYVTVTPLTYGRDTYVSDEVIYILFKEMQKLELDLRKLSTALSSKPNKQKYFDENIKQFATELIERLEQLLVNHEFTPLILVGLEAIFRDIERLIFNQKFDVTGIDKTLSNKFFSYSDIARKQNENLGYFTSAICNLYGIGTDRNLDTAISYFSEIYPNKEDEYKDCSYYLAHASLLNHQIYEAEGYLRKGDDENCILSMFLYATLLKDGIILLQDLDYSLELFRRIKDIEFSGYKEYLFEVRNKAIEEIENITKSTSDIEYSEADYHMNLINNTTNLPSKMDHEKYNILESHFGLDYVGLESNSMDAIYSSIILFEATNKKIELSEFSPVLLGLFKAIEIELSILFFNNFRDYLKHNLNKIKKDSISVNLFYALDKKKLRNKNNFTYGAIEHIVFPITNQRNFESYKNSAFSKYIKAIYPSYQDDKNNYEIIMDIAKQAEKIKEFRNRYLHKENSTYNELLNIYNYILNNSNLITTLLEFKASKTQNKENTNGHIKRT